MLPKERILELYFNAIEFGPRIYGIGAGRPALLRQAPLGAHPARGGVLLVDPAQPQAALHPVLPRAAVSALGQIRAADPAAGARTRPADRGGVRPGSGHPLPVRHHRPRARASRSAMAWVKKITARMPRAAPPERRELVGLEIRVSLPAQRLAAISVRDRRSLTGMSRLRLPCSLVCEADVVCARLCSASSAAGGPTRATAKEQRLSQ